MYFFSRCIWQQADGAVFDGYHSRQGNSDSSLWFQIKFSSARHECDSLSWPGWDKQVFCITGSHSGFLEMKKIDQKTRFEICINGQTDHTKTNNDV